MAVIGYHFPLRTAGEWPERYHRPSTGRRCRPLARRPSHGGDGTVAWQTVTSHGGRSSARLERQVVALEAGGSSPLAHPNRSGGVRGARAPRTLPGRSSERCASSSTAEQWTLNPLVPGSNPRGRTSTVQVLGLVAVRRTSGPPQMRPLAAASARRRSRWIGMGDADQGGGPFAQRSAAQLGDTPLGDDLVDGVLQRGHDVARRQLGDDLGDRVRPWRSTPARRTPGRPWSTSRRGRSRPGRHSRSSRRRRRSRWRTGRAGRRTSVELIDTNPSSWAITRGSLT